MSADKDVEKYMQHYHDCLREHEAEWVDLYHALTMRGETETAEDVRRRMARLRHPRIPQPAEKVA